MCKELLTKDAEVYLGRPLLHDNQVGNIDCHHPYEQIRYTA